MASVSLRCAGLPGWVLLPLDPDLEASEWAAGRTMRDGAGLEPVVTSIGAGPAASMLAAAVDRARSLWGPDVAAPLAFALQPDPLGPVLAVLDAALFPFEDTPFTAERMTALHGPATGPVVSETVKTAPGSGERFRGLFNSEARDVTENAATFALVEAVTYVVLPPGLDGYLWVDAQWHDVGLGDAIAGQVAQLLDTMVVEVTP